MKATQILATLWRIAVYMYASIMMRQFHPSHNGYTYYSLMRGNARKKLRGVVC